MLVYGYLRFSEIRGPYERYSINYLDVSVPGVFYIHGVYIKTLLSHLIRLIDTPRTRILEILK